MTSSHDDHEYYGGHSIEDDPHVYDNGVLINNFNIRNTTELSEMESQFSGWRGIELRDSPIYGLLDLEHAQKIHHHLFQDVYPWAGQLRAVDISKGGTEFTTVSKIADDFWNMSKYLKSSGLVVQKIDSEKEFSSAAGIYLGLVNQAHPFREGNGRTQRQLLRLLAQEHGYAIDWSGTSPESMKRACIESLEDPDCKALGKLIFLAQRKISLDMQIPPTIIGSDAFKKLYSDDIHSEPGSIDQILSQGRTKAPPENDPQP
jgi:cell filamentation protein